MKKMSFNQSTYKLLFIVFAVVVINGAQATASAVASADPHICDDKHFRNDFTFFNNLTNCEIVAGSISIALMDRIKVGEFEKWSFPKLKYKLMKRDNNSAQIHCDYIRFTEKLLDSWLFFVYEMLGHWQIYSQI